MLLFLCVFVCLCQHKLGSSEKRKSQLRKCLHQISLEASLKRSISLINDRYWRIQAIRGNATPEKLVLGFIRK